MDKIRLLLWVTAVSFLKLFDNLATLVIPTGFLFGMLEVETPVAFS